MCAMEIVIASAAIAAAVEVACRVIARRRKPRLR